jgi:hypothetical protein
LTRWLIDAHLANYSSSGMKRTVALSVGLGIGLAVMLWLGLEASDAIFRSRLLPWVVPLIHLQDIGFGVAACLFPCQKEGFDTGCEVYKRLPAFVGANALTYSILLLPIIYIWRRKATTTKPQ